MGHRREAKGAGAMCIERLRVAALCALAATLLLQGCAGTGLEKWHDVHLSEEFTLRDRAEVRDFDDYLELEKRLFAQLDEAVYAHTPQAAANSLVRYSAGSAADPRTRVPDWNHSFELSSAQPKGGVLLLHGMSDSPYSLRALGEALNREGYWVIGLRLPGHGTAPSGLKHVRWEDMAAAVRLAMTHLRTRVGDAPTHIVGYSNGGALAVNFGLDALDDPALPMPASLVLISPAIGIHGAAALAPWKRRLGQLPGLGALEWLNVEIEFDPYKYNSFATNAAEQVHRLTRSIARRLDRNRQLASGRAFPPTLVFKSNADATVSTEAVVTRLLNRIVSEGHQLVLFDVNRHAAKSVLMVYDPNALSVRVMGDPKLAFGVTLVTNESDDSLRLVAHHQPPFSAEIARTEALDLAWPPGVISLSHVALPFPPDDPLYGQRPPEHADMLFLGQMAVLGERGTLVLSSDWLLRLRHNPFYTYLETTVLDWIRNAPKPSQAAGGAAPGPGQ